MVGDYFYPPFQKKSMHAEYKHLQPQSGQMHVLIIGFGPAGQQVGWALKDQNVISHVIELNPHTAVKAKQMDLHVHIGDATSSEMLNHIGNIVFCAAVITLPDPKTCRDVLDSLKRSLPGVPILTRSRYHRYVTDLESLGAAIVVDEESTVGLTLANELIALMHKPNQDAMACALSGERSP